METIRAFAVHVLTACGAALALLALIFATGGHWEAMFFCLGLALIVDGADGPLAREFKVAEVLPRWSGDTLDIVVDFVTYVFVPAYAIAGSGDANHTSVVIADRTNISFLQAICAQHSNLRGKNLCFGERDLHVQDSG